MISLNIIVDNNRYKGNQTDDDKDYKNNEDKDKNNSNNDIK